MLYRIGPKAWLFQNIAETSSERAVATFGVCGTIGMCQNANVTIRVLEY
jgi:hypothetical protein